jgi:hypothetical protein
VQIEMHKGVYNLSDSGKRTFAAAFARIMREYLQQFGVAW